MGNINLDFYEEHKMAPEVQENEEIYCRKREKLFRQLGIPLISFRNADVVEFGPNRGNNALTLLTGFNGKISGIDHIDLVEPNPYGREGMLGLFQKHKIDENKYTIYTEMLEDFQKKREYDFIIAEEFIHYMPNWKQLIECIKGIASANTIIIVTCTNEIGIYVERMKRLIARYLIRGIENQDSQILEIERIFTPQLTALKGMSRGIRSYILDMFFDDVFLCQNTMSITDAIDAFGKEYDILGCSQNVFIDHSWFKDLSYDYHLSYKEQYHMKKHMYLLAGDTQESIRTVEDNNALEQAVIHANRLAAEFEKSKDLDMKEFRRTIDQVSKLARMDQITKFNGELLEILERLDRNENVDLSEYCTWCDTFGEGSQYLSLAKKG